MRIFIYNDLRNRDYFLLKFANGGGEDVRVLKSIIVRAFRDIVDPDLKDNEQYVIDLAVKACEKQSY